MSGIKAKVKMNPVALARLSAAVEKAFNVTVEGLLEQVKEDEVIPYDTGALQESHKIERVGDEHVTITSDLPYARRLYHHPEYNFKTDKNANARGEWLEPYIRGAERKLLHKTYIENIRKLSGGLVK